jgi:hypothetical protein
MGMSGSADSGVIVVVTIGSHRWYPLSPACAYLHCRYSFHIITSPLLVRFGIAIARLSDSFWVRAHLDALASVSVPPGFVTEQSILAVNHGMPSNVFILGRSGRIPKHRTEKQTHVL